MHEGATFGPYRVVRKLGVGGMGAVYLAEHTLIGRRAAIKVLLPELSAQRKSVDRFFNEARATSAVSDPGIVQMFDFGFTPEQTAFIVMEYLEGESLSARLSRLTTLTPAEALRVTRQVAGSLAAAHTAGIVHRDLKPDNLFLVRDAEAPGGERAKILDFGIAKLGDDAKMVTRTGQVIGTPVYMSPEQAAGIGAVDHRSDIYSLGCVLFQMITGRPPFDMDGMYAVITAHLQIPAPSLLRMMPHLPKELDAIVARCLAKAPPDRFSSMTDLQAACDALLAANIPELAIRRPASTNAVTVPTSGQQTTLGQSVGEPLTVTAPNRRVGLWIVSSAFAISVGVGLALIVGGRHTLVTPAASTGAAPIAAPAPRAPAPVAVVVTPAPPDAAPPPPAPPRPPPPPIDAGVTPQATHAKQRPAAPPPTPSNDSDDVYDDRN